MVIVEMTTHESDTTQEHLWLLLADCWAGLAESKKISIVPNYRKMNRVEVLEAFLKAKYYGLRPFLDMVCAPLYVGAENNEEFS